MSLSSVHGKPKLGDDVRLKNTQAETKQNTTKSKPQASNLSDVVPYKPTSGSDSVSFEEEDSEVDVLPLSQRIRLLSSQVEETVKPVPKPRDQRPQYPDFVDLTEELCISKSSHTANRVVSCSSDHCNDLTAGKKVKKPMQVSHKNAEHNIKPKPSSHDSIPHQAKSDSCTKPKCDSPDENGLKKCLEKTNKQDASPKMSLLSFLENDSDSCLLIASNEDESTEDQENLNPCELFKLDTSTQDRQKDGNHDGHSSGAPSGVKLSLSTFEKNAHDKRYISNLDIGSPNHSEAVQDRSHTGLATYSDSQIGHFTMNFSLQSDISGSEGVSVVMCKTPMDRVKQTLEEQSPRMIDLDTPPIGDEDHKLKRAAAMSSTPVSQPATAGTCNFSFEDSPMCLSQRLALQLGPSNSKLLSSFK